MTPVADGDSGQLPFDFDQRPSLRGEDFLVAPPNAEAVKWIDAWPKWPGPALIVFGPAGSGKTHLTRVFMQKSGALSIAAGDLARDPAMLLGVAPALVIENAEALVEGGLAEPMLHLYNLARETGGHLLFTATRPPARWDIKLRDLASRLNAATQVGIGLPDDALIAALLVKQFADRQLRVPDDVITFLMVRMERSFAAVRTIVAGIDKLSLAERRQITVPLVRRVLERQGN
ncbi:MAG TPA: DnaA/Hda family protein [Rhodospirillales bacterium]